MLSRNGLLLISICCLWRANPDLLLGQSTGYIEGKVIISGTIAPVPFAAVKLKENQLGVFANADGDFKIACNPEFLSDSLIITCIGYKRHSVSFKDLKSNIVNRIYLNPAIYGLAEVKVISSRKKLGSVTIIRRAIRNIKNNYPVKPYNYISYYRDYQKRDNNYINLNEAIVQTLDNGFSSKSITNEYRLLDFRKNMEFPRMEISPFYEWYVSDPNDNFNKVIPNAILGDQYGNELFILMVHDAIRNFDTRSFSFIETFSDDFISNHFFSEPTPVYNNNLLLYKIDFNSKSRISGGFDLMALGSIYIQPRDYTIHKLEYSCSYLLRGIGKKEMFNIDIEYGYENSVDTSMCLKYISFNNIFNVVDPDDYSFFRILNSYWEPSEKIKRTIILELNKNINSRSAYRKENYSIMTGNKIAKISNIEVIGRLIYIRLKDYVTNVDSTRINVENVKDTDGNFLNRQKKIELYQYRELFVQEYNKNIPFNDSCYIQYLPLEENCISKYPGKDKYWMNTPENIKNNK